VAPVHAVLPRSSPSSSCPSGSQLLLEGSGLSCSGRRRDGRRARGRAGAAETAGHVSRLLAVGSSAGAAEMRPAWWLGARATPLRTRAQQVLSLCASWSRPRLRPTRWFGSPRTTTGATQRGQVLLLAGRSAEAERACGRRWPGAFRSRHTGCGPTALACEDTHASTGRGRPCASTGGCRRPPAARAAPAVTAPGQWRISERSPARAVGDRPGRPDGTPSWARCTSGLGAPEAEERFAAALTLDPRTPRTARPRRALSARSPLYRLSCVSPSSWRARRVFQIAVVAGLWAS